MADATKLSGGMRFLIAAACFVVAVAGMKAAGALIVPFLLAVFISIICMPPLTWLKGLGVPRGLAIPIVLLVIMILGLGVVTLLGSSLNSFSENLPAYQQRLAAQMSELLAWLRGHGVNLPEGAVAEQLDPGTVMRVAAEALTGLSSVLTNAFLIVLTVVFILFEATGFTAKVRAAVKNPKRSLAGAADVTGSVNRYLALKTVFSLSTGVAIAVWLWAMGVDYPLLWGFCAFALNYIPNIGSIIAALPAVLLAFVQFGFIKALIVAGGYAVVNVVLGSIVEPRVMGRGLGLSTLVVFVSLVFWGWVLGPVGMILSVPLTMLIKIVMEKGEDTRWISVMLGPSPSE